MVYDGFHTCHVSFLAGFLNHQHFGLVEIRATSTSKPRWFLLRKRAEPVSAFGILEVMGGSFGRAFAQDFLKRHFFLGGVGANVVQKKQLGWCMQPIGILKNLGGVLKCVWYFHPDPWGWWSNLTSIFFQLGGSRPPNSNWWMQPKTGGEGFVT